MWFVHSDVQMPSLARLSKRFHAAEKKMSIWFLVSLGQYLRTHLKDHARYDQGPEIYGEPRKVLLPFSEAQLAGCLRVQVGGPLEWDTKSSNYAQNVVQDTVNEVSVSTATPDWHTVLSC